MIKPGKSKPKTKVLVLLDAHAILHRGYHALPNFTTKSGEPTGGLYGLSSMLLGLLNQFKPDYLAAGYDLPEPTFRRAAFEGYKAGRKKADDELVSQLVRSRDIFSAFGIPIYEQAGFEADDVIGTIVEQTKKIKDLRVIIASGDLDTLQLVTGKRVVVFTLKRGLNDVVLYDEPAVKNRFGFGPEKLVDYKGLRGDPSDNIPGVHGIGDKTATDLIQKFGSLEQIYQSLKTDRPKFFQAGFKERVIELLEKSRDEAEFSKTLATIRRDVPINFKLPERSWSESLELERIVELFQALEFRTLIERVKKMAAPVALAPAGPGPGEISFNPEILSRAKIAAWLLNSDLTNPSGEEILQLAKAENMEVGLKNLEDQVASAGLEKVYREIELPLSPILRAMESRGVLVDLNYLKGLAKDYRAKLAKIEKKIYELAGGKFNINSPRQLGEILFDKLGISPSGVKKTPGGARSTRESELVKLQDRHAVIPEILKYRVLAKLLSTYINNLPGLVGEDGALHTTYNQTGTTTGRLSSSDPNLQNLPADPELGLPVRRAFVARPGRLFLAFDYSQIEMRVLAILSDDKSLQKIFKAGEDVHTAVASRVFGVAESEVTKEMRRRAKVINFGIIYGMGINALKVNLGGSRDEAAVFLKKYFETFPTIKDYFERVKGEARGRGYTETLFGRRRLLPAINSPVPPLKAAAERAAMNAPLQGTAADIIKIAMINCVAKLKEKNLAAQAELLLQIHDELIFEVEEKSADQAASIIKAEMEDVLTGAAVPLTISEQRGSTWADL